MYATEVAFSYATKNQDVAERARSYGIPGIQVDGNDVIAIHEAAGAAIERARAGHGPTLIEARTYRTRPHAEGMRDAGYRTADEIAEWKQRDPITLLREGAVSRGIADDAAFDAIEDEIKAIVADALEFATTSPFPEPSTATLFIFSDPQEA
jgi:TPP-dependent pyruvate/acetoin dehydrogenase alpha subunit